MSKINKLRAEREEILKKLETNPDYKRLLEIDWEICELAWDSFPM